MGQDLNRASLRWNHRSVNHIDARSLAPFHNPVVPYNLQISMYLILSASHFANASFMLIRQVYTRRRKTVFAFVHTNSPLKDFFEGYEDLEKSLELLACCKLLQGVTFYFSSHKMRQYTAEKKCV